MSKKLYRVLFCGSVKIHSIDPDEFIPAYRLVCIDCGAGTDYYYTKEEALAAWNKRINEEFVVDEIGGFHNEGLGWNPNGVFCGECSNTTCVNCPMKDERS